MKLHMALIALFGFVLGLSPTAVRAQESCPVIPVDSPGVQRIEGQGSYSFYGIPLCPICIVRKTH